MANIDIPESQNSEKIGSGAAGEVYCVSDPSHGSKRAVKQLNSIAIDRESLERNCLVYSRAPKHPGVVDLCDFQLDTTPYFLSMEWIEDARTLDSLSVPLGEAEAWRVIREIAEAMAHLHKHGVWHGNLHPGNIFAGPEKSLEVRVGDFGPGMTGPVHHIDIGETAWFAPPEQLENAEEFEHGNVQRWDVYRFGVIAYWLITGELPRGQRYAAERSEAVANSGGRPVSVDFIALAEDVRQNPDSEWKAPTEESAFQLRREIVDRCLSINPAERPVDLREVRNSFHKLEARFTLEGAEKRVGIERRRQKRKVFLARAAAACLAASLLAVSFFLVQYWNRSKSFQGRVSELALVVDHQKREIELFDQRWSRAEHDLEKTREAADSFFSQMAQLGGAAAESHTLLPAGDNRIKQENLEKSRLYFQKTLADLPEESGSDLERARSFHNLAHIESQLGNRTEARQQFEEAAGLFEAIASSGSDEISIVGDCESRLADCYEQLAGMTEADPSDEMLRFLKRASHYLNAMRERDQDEKQVAMRLTMNDYKLARQLHAHREFDSAIAIYASAGERVAGMVEENPDLKVLTEMLTRLQFDMAISLRDAGRTAEAVDAHLATMETITTAAGEQPYTIGQQTRLGMSYHELGELFLDRAKTEEVDDLFTESLRLLTSACESNPADIPAVLALARTMGHIAQIDRENARWTEGYRTSLAAIRKLEAALEQSPGHFDCQLTLVDLRASHTVFLQYQKSAAQRCVNNGLVMAESVGDQLERDDSISDPVQKNCRIRLAKIYDRYGKLCRSLGLPEKARMCEDRATRARELMVQRDAAELPIGQESL